MEEITMTDYPIGKHDNVNSFTNAARRAYANFKADPKNKGPGDLRYDNKNGFYISDAWTASKSKAVTAVEKLKALVDDSYLPARNTKASKLLFMSLGGGDRINADEFKLFDKIVADFENNLSPFAPQPAHMPPPPEYSATDDENPSLQHESGDHQEPSDPIPPHDEVQQPSHQQAHANEHILSPPPPPHDAVQMTQNLQPPPVPTDAIPPQSTHELLDTGYTPGRPDDTDPVAAGLELAEDEIEEMFDNDSADDDAHVTPGGTPGGPEDK
jgi:hypothetical protein